jgi:hypothetical protein
MPFDGSGNFTRSYNFVSDRDNSIRILATRMDGEFDNFAAGMNVVFFRNGLVPLSGNLNMGQNYISNLGAGSVASLPFKFGDDPNSGIFLDGINKPSIAVSGTKRLEANTTGIVVTGNLNVSGTSTLNAVSGTTGTFSGVTSGGSPVWTAANDGAGSGLDADLLDGQQGTYYGDIAARLGYTPVNRAGDTMSGNLTIASSFVSVGVNVPGGGGNVRVVRDNGSLQWAAGILGSVGSTNYSIYNTVSATNDFEITTSGLIGFGTVAPESKHHVKFATTSTNNEVLQTLETTSIGGTAINFKNAFGNLCRVIAGPLDLGGGVNDGVLEFQTAVATVLGTRMTINNVGNVGIGVTPTTLFHVRTASDTTKALISGLTKGARFNTNATEMRIEGVSHDNVSFQPLWLGGTQVSMSESGAETSRFSGTNLRVLGNVFVGSVSAGNQLATLASPTFTGVPAAPTPANGTNTTQLATTAFVQNQLTANAYAPLASPNFSGTAQYGGLEIGYRDIVRVTGAIERGKCFATAAGFTLNTGTAAGGAYSVYNDSAAAIIVTQGAGLTLRLAGTTTVGSRTLAARSFATIWFNSTTEAIMSGAGVS